MSRLRDVDVAARAQKLYAAFWAAFAGIIFGILAAAWLGAIAFVPAWLLGGALIYFLILGLAGGVSSAVASAYVPSGSSTPARREYSQGDALAAQGKLEAAVREYERCIDLHPADPEPRLRLARLLRDRLQQPAAAGQWFRQILQMPNLTTGTELLVAHELVELYTVRLHEPARALPILARVAERFGERPEGEWAVRGLIELKQQVRESHG